VIIADAGPLDVARIRGGVAQLGWEAAGMSEFQYYEFLALDRPRPRPPSSACTESLGPKA
jgi:hypothetical protein